jgi:peptidoglycan hydrolase-like protein with peptidoglycan-binding domain
VPNRRHSTSADRGAIAAAIAQHPREFVGLVTGGFAVLTILINALFLQHGPHPAPIFATRFWTRPAKSVILPPHNPRTVQPARVAPPAEPVTPARTQAQLTYDIQRELARRDFYDGAVDGIWGAKTDAAVRGFVKAAGLTVDPQPSEALLRAIVASRTHAGVSGDAAPAVAPVRNDPIAAALAPSKRILAIQHALADFGYGQIKPTGIVDGDTQNAIERFQRDRGMPVDGHMSDGFVRALAAMTGRPLE